MSHHSIDDVLKELAREVMQYDGVSGIAQGLESGSPCIVIYVQKDEPLLRNKLPSEVGGFTIKVEVTGAFNASN